MQYEDPSGCLWTEEQDEDGYVYYVNTNTMVSAPAHSKNSDVKRLCCLLCSHSDSLINVHTYIWEVELVLPDEQNMKPVLIWCGDRVPRFTKSDRQWPVVKHARVCCKYVRVIPRAFCAGYSVGAAALLQGSSDIRGRGPSSISVGSTAKRICKLDGSF